MRYGALPGAAPSTAEPGKHATVKVKKPKVKTANVKTAKAKAHKQALAKSRNKQVVGKSKHQTRSKRKTPAETTGSIAPGSVPTPGLYWQLV